MPGIGLGSAPRAKDDPVRAGGGMMSESRPPATSSSGAGGAGDILVVDDDEDVLAAILEMLEEHGLHAVGARDEAQAEAIARLSRPSLVLLDYHLRGADSGPLAARLRAEHG